MARLLTTRRSEWLPGVAVLGAAVGIAAVLGLSLRVRSWPIYVGLVVAVLFAFGALERWRERRHRAPPPPRARGKLKVIQGGKFDLKNDDSTDTQRWLM